MSGAVPFRALHHIGAAAAGAVPGWCRGGQGGPFERDDEYAWVLDTTKGHINCYVGPNKTSLAQTDQTVVFDEREKRFVNAEIPQAIQLFATAPENWYLVLKNPAVDGGHPRPGVSSGLAELQVGKKVMLRGPTPPSPTRTPPPSSPATSPTTR
jgi:major vault protein